MSAETGGEKSVGGIVWGNYVQRENVLHPRRGSYQLVTDLLRRTYWETGVVDFDFYFIHYWVRQRGTGTCNNKIQYWNTMV